MKNMICNDHKNCSQRLECDHAIPHDYNKHYCDQQLVIENGYFTKEKCTCVNLRLQKLKKLNILK